MKVKKGRFRSRSSISGEEIILSRHGIQYNRRSNRKDEIPAVVYLNKKSLDERSSVWAGGWIRDRCIRSERVKKVYINECDILLRSQIQETIPNKSWKKRRKIRKIRWKRKSRENGNRIKMYANLLISKRKAVVCAQGVELRRGCAACFDA